MGHAAGFKNSLVHGSWRNCVTSAKRHPIDRIGWKPKSAIDNGCAGDRATLPVETIFEYSAFGCDSTNNRASLNGDGLLSET